MMKSLQRIGIVSFSTILSRVLGLLRDILTFSVFGTSALNSAFLFAFTLPNLFRRLLGEGALTAAMVPVLSSELEKGGRPAAFSLLGKVSSWLLLASAILVALFLLAFSAIPFFPGLELRWHLSADLARLVFPYLIFVCLAAILGAALNVMNRFAIPALSAVWLNVAMIAFLWTGTRVFSPSPEGAMRFLCVGVLVGGVVQLLVPLAALAREGWRPRLDWKASPSLAEIGRLMLPGLAGTAIFQINVVVSRSLAFIVDESAVAVLYLANRLMEFPLGIFAIAVATVIFPQMARHAVAEEYGLFGRSYRRGLLLILLIMIPAAAGIFLLRDTLVAVLFQWGSFGSADTALASPVVAVFACTLPFYSGATFATRGFHSLKNTRTPVIVAGWSFLLNLGCSLALMGPLGMIGLALANLVSIMVQSAALQILLVKERPEASFHQLRFDLLKILAATALMGLCVYGLDTWAEALGGDQRWLRAPALAVSIAAGTGIYFTTTWLLRVEGRNEIEVILRRFLTRGEAVEGGKDCGQS